MFSGFRLTLHHFSWLWVEGSAFWGQESSRTLLGIYYAVPPRSAAVVFGVSTLPLKYLKIETSISLNPQNSALIQPSVQGSGSRKYKGRSGSRRSRPPTRLSSTVCIALTAPLLNQNLSIARANLIRLLETVIQLLVLAPEGSY